jgi:FAD:protein FMN transferase
MRSRSSRPSTRRTAEEPTTAIHRLEALMGTVIGIDVRDADFPDPVVDEVFRLLREIERRFSTYRADSEVSRYGRREIADHEVSDELREVLDLCEAVRIGSGGAFDIRRHRPDGIIDPTGLVKGWAVEQAATVLRHAGAQSYALNAGGDIIVRGEPVPGRRWRVGIQHPEIRDAMAAVLEVRDLAVATSGAYERGQHVIDALTGSPPAGLLSVTVTGPSLTFADAYATAAFAMGAQGIHWVAALPEYEACVVTSDHRLVWTEGFTPLLVRSAIESDDVAWSVADDLSHVRRIVQTHRAPDLPPVEATPLRCQSRR